MVSVEKRRDQLPFKSCEVPTFDMPRSWHEKRGTTLPSFHLRSPERRSQRSNAREPASVGTGWASAANGAQLRCAGLGLGLTPGTLVPAGATRRGRICQNRGWPKKNVFFLRKQTTFWGSWTFAVKKLKPSRRTGAECICLNAVRLLDPFRRPELIHQPKAYHLAALVYRPNEDHDSCLRSLAISYQLLVWLKDT